MKILTTCVALALGFSLSCSSSRPKGKSFGSNGGNDGSKDPQIGETADVNKDGSINLELTPEVGSKLRFLNGNALTIVYKRVFKEDANGFAHCEKQKPIEHTGCSNLFNAEERPSMGIFDLYSERMSRGVQNVAQTESMTLNYTRNLRAALGRECKRLVDREIADPSPSNQLIKDSSLAEAHLEAFMRKLMDAPESSFELDIPFSDYVKAFQVASAMGSGEKAKSDAYTNLCISLGMDPQIFMY